MEEKKRRRALTDADRVLIRKRNQTHPPSLNVLLNPDDEITVDKNKEHSAVADPENLWRPCDCSFNGRRAEGVDFGKRQAMRRFYFQPLPNLARSKCRLSEIHKMVRQCKLVLSSALQRQDLGDELLSFVLLLLVKLHTSCP